MAAPQTLTAPLAVITDSSGKAIAKVRNLRIRESHQLGEVRGISNVTVQELPVLAINCSGSFDFYNVDFNTSTIPNANKRDFNSLAAYVQNILLTEGSTIRLKRKVQDSIDPNTKHKTTRLETYATIKGIQLEEDSMDVSEGQLSTKTQSFRYTDPVLIGL